MKNVTIRLALALSLFFVGASAFGQSNERPVNWKDLPEPFHTDSARNRPEVISRPDGAVLQLPKGFTIEEYMSGFVRPRFMMLGPSNEVLLSDSGSRDGRDGIIYVLKDGSMNKVIDGLDRPYGLELDDGWLYVAETTSVKRYRYDAEAMKVTGGGEEIIPLGEFGQGHWTRTLLFDRDHEKLYLTVGSRSNIDLDEDPMRAALHRFNPDGSGHETVATGLRNIIGLRWYPGTEDLWAAVQERDGLGDDLVPDYVVKIKEGGFYGWPISYIGPHREPRHEKVDEAKVKSTLYPDVLLGAHVAVLDILFYTGEQFPPEYQGGMFLAFHGSWNRAERIGYEVAFVPFADGEPTAGPESFLRGWMLDPKKREVWGRPVGLLQASDGSLIVSDDGGGKLWRISYVD
ncbi:MAG TPA: PQQ-dependent sugar dehydrogenase [Vicinamibacteria bacterium]|nr:PQQ-dependent sugar dehydrogenase [Vicinamibacteria bacterium]